MKRLEEKQQLHNLRPFLVWRFTLFLLGTGIIEMTLSSLLNRYIFPLMQNIFWKDISFDSDISNGAVLGVLGLILLELLILALASFLPGNWQQVVRQLADGLEEMIYRKVPELRHAAVLRMNFSMQLLLFCMLLLILVLLVLPIVLAAGGYATMVAREFKRVEQLREDQYIQMDKQRNLMLSDIAHDLRTPITTVSGYAKALHDGMVKDPVKQQEYLEAIMNKSGRMEDLIQLLFEYSKLNSTGFALHKEKGDLAELMRENVALLYDDVEAACMELEIDLPEEPCPARFDKLELSRVITNLITNAIKHNEKGTKIGISLTSNAYDETYCILIADNGKAIDKEVADHLFEPFAVGDRSRSTKGGSGLGLSIAAKIVEMHGSTLTLRTQVKGYTKAFAFELDQEEH